MAYGSHCRRPVCDLDRDLIIVPLKHRSAQVRSSMHFLWPACSIVVRAMAGAVPRDHCGRGRDAAVVEAEIEVREIAEAWNGGLARPLEGTSRNLTRSDDYDRNGLDSRSSYGLGAPPARGAAPSFGAPPTRGEEQHRALGHRPPAVQHPASEHRPPVVQHPASEHRPPVAQHRASGHRPPVEQHRASGHRPPVEQHPASEHRLPVVQHLATGHRPPVEQHPASEHRLPVARVLVAPG